MYCKVDTYYGTLSEYNNFLEFHPDCIPCGVIEAVEGDYEFHFYKVVEKEGD